VFSYVVLFFAEKGSKKIVGFSFYKKTTEGCLKISGDKTKSASVRSNSFILANEIKPDLYAGKYAPREYETEEEGKIYYIELSCKQDKK